MKKFTITKSGTYLRLKLKETGEIASLWEIEGLDRLALRTERGLYEAHLDACALRDWLPEPLKHCVDPDIDETNKARAAIQAYKMERGIRLDTPLCIHDSVPATATLDIPDPTIP